MAPNFNFDNLAVNKVATDQWVKLAGSIYATPKLEKSAKVMKFISSLTGKGVSEAGRVAGEAGRLAGEAGVATGKARTALTAVETAGVRGTEAVARATRSRDIAKADIAGLGLGQKVVAKIKQPFGKGQYAKLKKSESGLAKVKIEGGPGGAATKASKGKLTAAEQAEAQAVKSKTEAEKALRIAKADQSAARTGAGMVAGTGLLGAAAMSGGGGGRRGPVIVT
jgi:hypothetical protein